MSEKTFRRQFFANKMHREIFWLIFLAVFTPTIITTVSLFYLIFNITAEQIGIPEAIAYNILPAAQRVTIILLVTIPLAVVGILVLTHKLTHNIVGPFDRIVRELGECVDGKRNGPITVRQSDKFLPLVNRINQLLAKLKK